MRFWPRRREPERRETLKNPSEAFVRDLQDYFGTATVAGRTVTPEKAITGTIAVYACVGIIADSVATLPMLVYRDAGDSRVRLPDTDPLARLLHRFPNPELTAQETYEALTGHVCLWGNAYGLLERDGSGAATEVWPLRPDMMEVFILGGDNKVYDPRHIDPRALRGARRVYRYQLPDGERLVLPRENILHVRGLATNGFVGLSPITVARNAVAVEQAAGEFAGRFYANSAVPGSILTFPTGPGKPNLDKPEKEQIRNEWTALYGGASKAHKIAILEGGVTWQAVGMPLEDAQFVETRKFQIAEVARLYRIPPHLVGDVERSTSWGTGIEQQTLGFLVYTLRPWLERIEQAIDRDLGSGRGGESLSDRGLIAEFLVEGLLRGDTLSRFRAYEIGLRNKFLVPNEPRRAENLPPLPGGDEPIDVPGAPASTPSPDDGSDKAA